MNYYDILSAVYEMNNEIVGCRVDNVFSTISGNVYVFRLICKNLEKFLLIEPGKRIHLTKYTRLKELDSKVMKLRELVRDSIVQNIEVIDRERIVKITLSNGNIIYIEIIPRGVLVVTNLEDVILFASEYREMKDRKIKLNLKYVLPPRQELKEDDFQKILKKGNLSKILGIPQEIIELLNLKISKIEEIEIIKKKIEEIENNIKSGNIVPCKVRDTIVPFNVEGCIKYSGSYNEALDEYFLEIEKKESEEKLKEELEKERQKIINTIESIKSEISNFRIKAEQARKIADLLMLKMQDVQEIINSQKFRKDIKSDKIILQLEGLEVEIDPKISIGKNASIYYEIAKEYEEKIKSAMNSIQKLQERLMEIEREILEKKEEVKISIKKREWYERYRWSFTVNNLLVLAGRDISQNESIVKKYLTNKDIFLHADIQGAAATVLKTDDGKFSEDDINDAALIAGCYSKAWKIGFGSIEVYWVYGSQVSKSPPSGEYLQKGSFMIYGKKNYVKVKLELYLGLEKIENSFRVIVGSERVVKNRAYKIYFKIVPGNTDPSKLSEKILKILTKELNLKGLSVLKDEIIRALPGKSEIDKVIKIE
ncbi:MAG: ribosome rescue protein RqcH [Sulfolobaceae archaeon]